MKYIEDRIQEKYDEVEVPEYMFDTSRVFKRVENDNNSSKKKVLSLIACLFLIMFIALALLFVLPKNIREKNIEVDIKGNNNTDTDIKAEIVAQTIKSKDVDLNSKYIISISNTKIVEYQIINNIPYTKIKAQVMNSYLGNLSGEIEMYVPGGIFSIKDIKENVNYDQIDDISAFKDEDKVKVTYYNEIYIPVAEEGKTYITTLNEVDGEYFVNMNSKYCFKEYNPETNIVKDDMGDEQLDIQKYLDSINL